MSFIALQRKAERQTMTINVGVRVSRVVKAYAEHIGAAECMWSTAIIGSRRGLFLVVGVRLKHHHLSDVIAGSSVVDGAEQHEAPALAVGGVPTRAAGADAPSAPRTAARCPGATRPRPPRRSGPPRHESPRVRGYRGHSETGWPDSRAGG